MPIASLNHLINGIAVPYTRRCELISHDHRHAVVKIKGAADGHYRLRTVLNHQVKGAQWDETRLSGGIGSDAERDGDSAEQAAAV
jgi:hypothetical protein